MDLHLVGGFLGSGKTTAIIGAARLLMAQGKRVGVVTNDRGKHLVDTAFFQGAGLPTAEVAGGCFRCSFSELKDLLSQLQAEAQPDVVFAESVGSCADMVATVLSPLLELQSAADRHTTFSVFSDIRLLRRWLTGEELPYGEDVAYIYGQQISEAGLLVINKMDLLSEVQAQQVLAQARERLPDKTLLLQNSLAEGGTAQWLELLAAGKGIAPPTAIEMDYDRYDRGNRKLGWLDEEIRLQVTAGAGWQVVLAFISALEKAIQQKNIPVGHLKFHITDGAQELKLSLVALSGQDWQAGMPGFSGETLRILVNGRIQAAPAYINRLVGDALETAAAQGVRSYERAETAYYRPRIASRIPR
jgi:Ni2+-binding GTPase involved in maturation of urease and hydrogenase